ncbi:hypothetical protein Tco_1328329 [Tanacetum coccineum]
MEITATIDGKFKIVSEASIRRHLKLKDSNGISDFPTTKIFKQLALIGQETEVPRPSSPTQTHVADEAASTCVDDRHRGAATTVSDLEARQGSEEVAQRPHRRVKFVEESEPTQTKTKIQQEQERLGFEEAQRLQEQFDEEERQRIASVHEEAKLINERKRQFDQQRAQQRRNRPLTQAQQRSYMCNYIKHMGIHTLQQLRGYSFDEIKVLFEAIVKRVNTFTLMESVDTVPKVVVGSSKRSAEEELGEESSKRQKIGEGSEPAKESKDKESDEMSQEQLQQLIIIVPEEGMNVEAYKPNTQSLTGRFTLKIQENTRKSSEWVIIQRERFSSTEPTDDKERALWVKLKRLFEPHTNDLLELQRYMHDPLTWRLYDTCGVHHVSTETGLDIFMLAEKDYSLTRGLPMLMLVNKLQVDQQAISRTTFRDGK